LHDNARFRPMLHTIIARNAHDEVQVLERRIYSGLQQSS
jgi:hypothetical protein